jgi:soluble lytic murein transglycosylase
MRAGKKAALAGAFALLLSGVSLSFFAAPGYAAAPEAKSASAKSVPKPAVKPAHKKKTSKSAKSSKKSPPSKKTAAKPVAKRDPTKGARALSSTAPSLSPEKVNPILTNSTRVATVNALRTARAGDWRTAAKIIAATRDPLSIRLYDWLYFTRTAQPLVFTEIASYIRANPSWPSQEKLRAAAEQAISPANTDDEIVYWFRDYPPRRPETMDRYLRALATEGRREELAKAVNAFWRKAQLTTPQQTRFVSAYGSYITRESHAARLDRLLFGQQYSNARAIAKILGRGYPALTEARMALAENNAGVDRFLAAVPAALQADPGLLYERLEWRVRNNMDFEAMEILHMEPESEKINNPEEWWRQRQIVARHLIENKQYQSAYLLVDGSGLTDGASFVDAEFLAGWLALRYTKQPWPAFQHFEKLYHKATTPVSRSRGAYWAGRASDELGYHDTALKWYRAAARHQTTFYGQMAAAALPESIRPPQQSAPPHTVAGETAFRARPLVQAAGILQEAGFHREAGIFLDKIAEGAKTPEDFELAADYSEEIGHYNNAIKIAKKALLQNVFLMEHSYPTMLTRMKGIAQEWALVHAVIRQESSFDLEAQSSAGALGLMQLMPATAREVAKKNHMSADRNLLVTNANHNIKLGSLYLQMMLDRYDNSYPLALAAYNAGPGRVDKWLRVYGDPRTKQINMVDWIELIPLSETRNYVQRCLENTYIYRLKLKDVQKSATAPIHVAFVP